MLRVIIWLFISGRRPSAAQFKSCICCTMLLQLRARLSCCGSSSSSITERGCREHSCKPAKVWRAKISLAVRPEQPPHLPHLLLHAVQQVLQLLLLALHLQQRVLQLAALLIGLAELELQLCLLLLQGLALLLLLKGFAQQLLLFGHCGIQLGHPEAHAFLVVLHRDYSLGPLPADTAAPAAHAVQ